MHQDMPKYLTRNFHPSLMAALLMLSHATATAHVAPFIPAPPPLVQGVSTCEGSVARSADVAAHAHLPKCTTAVNAPRTGLSDALCAARHRASGGASPKYRPTPAGSIHRRHAPPSVAVLLTCSAPVA